MRQRVSAVIIKDEKILLIHRVKPDKEYFVFLGGGIEEGESAEEALKREAKEELGIEVKKMRLLFELVNQHEHAYLNMHHGNQREYFFLVEEYAGVPEMCGNDHEKSLMSPANQYLLVWIPLAECVRMKNICPVGAVRKIISAL